MVFLPFKGIPEEELLRQQQELFQQARLQQAQVIYTYKSKRPLLALPVKLLLYKNLFSLKFETDSYFLKSITKNGTTGQIW